MDACCTNQASSVVNPSPVQLRKLCRIGGPITAVCLVPLSLPNENDSSTTMSTETTPDNEMKSDDSYCLLWGCGPYLHKKEQDQTSSQLLVFDKDGDHQEGGGSIHGIHPIQRTRSAIATGPPTTRTGHFDVIVFGACQFAICRIVPTSLRRHPTVDGELVGRKDTKEEEKEGTMVRVDLVVTPPSSAGTQSRQHQAAWVDTKDWICDVETIPDGERSRTSDDDTISTTLIVGMARNIIDIWAITEASSATTTKRRPETTVSFQQRIHGALSTMVTAMHVSHLPSHSDNGQTTWIAAGTSFQEIQVWALRPSLSLEDAAMTTTNVDPKSNATPADEATALDIPQSLTGHAGVIHSVRFSKHGQSLVSASDDRSIRVWHAHDNNNALRWSLKWIGWGHVARIWGVDFVEAEDDHIAPLRRPPSSVISVCEDRTTRVWSYDTGALLACIKHGCILWNVSTLGSLAAVGTTNGTVAVYDLTSYMREQQLPTFISIPDDRKTPPTIPSEGLQQKPQKRKNKKGAARNAQVMVGLQWSTLLDNPSTSILVALTRGGALMFLNTDANEWHHLDPWCERVTDSDSRSQSIDPADGCTMSLRCHSVAIGTSTGRIVLLENFFESTARRSLLSIGQTQKVNSFRWFNESVLISIHVRSVVIWDVQIGVPMRILHVTAKGIPLCATMDALEEWAVVGDSRGNILMYDIRQRADTQSTNGMPACVLERVHHKEHVTDVKIKNGQLLSVGNDGCAHISFFDGNCWRKGRSFAVFLLTGGMTIQRWDAPTRKQTGIMLLFGYHGHELRLIEQNSGREIYSFDTGGRQRHCDFHLLETPRHRGTGVEIQATVLAGKKDGTNELFYEKIPLSEKAGTARYCGADDGFSMHGESIFSCSLFSFGQTSATYFFLTGSEDCQAKLSAGDANGVFQSTPLLPQESCIRSVCSSQLDDKQSSLLVVGGGKLALQFYLVRPRFSPCCGVGDVEINFLGKGPLCGKAEIDQRINEVKAIAFTLGSNRTHFVIAGDSSGSCHFFLVDESTEVRPRQGVSICVSERPVLALDLLRIGNRILIIVGTTGGDVLLYQLPGALQQLEEELPHLMSHWSPVTSFQAHQMGTNVLTGRLLTDGSQQNHSRVVIVSGGDDQALCMSVVELSLDNQGRLNATNSHQEVVKDCSFSAIKGIFAFTKDGVLYVAVAGYSQRLSLWLCDVSTMRLSPVSAIPIDLGDVNCLSGLHQADGAAVLAIGGYGVEMFSTLNELAADLKDAALA